MNDDDKIIRSGPLKGKKIELAPTAGIALFQAIAEEFMSRVFGSDPGDYLITDESSLADFIGVDDMELANIQQKIRDIYGLEVSELPAGNLLESFIRIHERQSDQSDDS